MARSNVPKFGNWENEDSVPYTVYFDKARKKKGEKLINPNDPQENPDMFPNMPATKPEARHEEPIRRPLVRPKTPEHREAEFRQSSDSSTRSSESAGRRTYNNNESSYGGRGQRPVRSARPDAGFYQNSERSPLHPQYQAKGAGRGGGGSPAWEGKPREGSNQVRSRLRPGRGDESPGKSPAAVPKFGAWNDSDPQSAENFTHIFNRVRDERNAGGMGNPSATPKHPSYIITRSNEPKKCCFPWW